MELELIRIEFRLDGTVATAFSYYVNSVYYPHTKFAECGF